MMMIKGLFKRLKNIEDKNKEQLKLLSNANKTSKTLLFTSFTETFKTLKIGQWNINAMI